MAQELDGIRGRRSIAPTAADPEAIERYKEELNKLQDSHIALSVQVSHLSKELQSTRRLAQDTHAIVRGPCSFSERSLHRAILFANIAAVQALESTHSEFSRTYTSLCPGNCVRQITLRSKRSDCTLFDIRQMISHFVNQDSLRCAISPSAFFAMTSSTVHPSIIEIAFENFSDLCDALMISGDHRAAGVYRKRAVNYRSTRVLRRVQVLGVDTKCSNSLGDGTSVTVRKILLARSMLSENDGSVEKVHVLHQQSTNWSDNTWEDKFVYKEEDIASLREFKMTSLLDDEPASTGRRMNRPRKSKVEQSFVLRWEICAVSPHPSDADPQLIPGTLRVFFPAVVMRSIVLIDSVRTIFSTAINDRTMQDILCSTSVPDLLQQ